jgi:4-amino-4-deoxy-L-arabinose transferase-like glycosyltransferase
MSAVSRSVFDSRRFFFVVLVAATLLHAALAVALPISGDEAYYWDCSRHLDWSYFDQPPLVIWTMVPFRAVLGETRLAVRAPAVVASLLIGVFLLPVVRRLGGGPRQATVAYLLLHATPLYFLGSFYCSTDVVMAAAFVAAVWAATAVAQGERRAWWGVAVAVGLGFLAKFPAVLALAALLPALVRGPAWRDLRTATPYLAGAQCLGLTAPVWVWGVRHDWANISFQIAGRHGPGPPALQSLAEFVAGNLLLATPFLALAVTAAWWLARRHHDPGWRSVRVAAVTPLLVFAAAALVTRVSPHWAAPGLMVAFILLGMVEFRARRMLSLLGVVFGLALSLAAIAVVLGPEPLLEADWRYRGRPHRISTAKLAALVGNQEMAEAVMAERRTDELVASESYSTVHLLAFLSGGELPTRLAHVKPGKHGLASLYWYPPAALRGRDVLFVTEKHQVDERLSEVFEEVEEEKPIQIVHEGRTVREIRLLRCRNLLRPEGVFTRLPTR